MLEVADLGALDAPATRELVETKLRQFGLADPAAHPGAVDPVADVLSMLHALAGARVHENGPTIAAICSGPGGDRHAAEWQFTMPARGGDLRQLAGLLAEHGSDPARGYAPRLAGLPNQVLRGFLGGFADLIAEHEGRFWILDWKSNHLGDDASDYGPDALRAAMYEHDYVLQYHLYSLALHRHLRQRQRGYDPERHLGGVCYPFLRGAVARTNNGMFFDRPPAALLAAMDEWAGGRT
jgi:exodeoxyribonuclease V beta subunit